MPGIAGGHSRPPAGSPRSAPAGSQAQGAATRLPPGSASTAPRRPSRGGPQPPPGPRHPSCPCRPAPGRPGPRPTPPHPLQPPRFQPCPHQDRVITKDTGLLQPVPHLSGPRRPFLKISSSPEGAAQGARPHPVQPRPSGAKASGWSGGTGATQDTQRLQRPAGLERRAPGPQGTQGTPIQRHKPPPHPRGCCLSTKRGEPQSLRVGSRGAVAWAGREGGTQT